MHRKVNEKKTALKLRKQGYSYSEILVKIGVSRSTLSEWLRNVRITNSQIERLRLKNADARKLGSIALRQKRIDKTKKIIEKTKLEIKKLNNDDLKIIGAILYWAEGSKQTKNEPSRELIFTNSDPKMIKIYLLWLKKCLLIKPEDIKFEIYIHETYNKNSNELSSYWSEVTNFPIDKFGKVYLKKNKVNSFRKNRGEEYKGVLRISVRKSTDINRKVMGWVKGICLQSGIK